MTGPDGATWGAWRVTAVDPPTSLEFTDALRRPGRDAGRGQPVITRVRLTKHDGATQMQMHLTFASRQAMNKLSSTGLVDGLRQAVSQIDSLLT